VLPSLLIALAWPKPPEGTGMVSKLSADAGDNCAVTIRTASAARCAELNNFGKRRPPAARGKPPQSLSLENLMGDF
jgi:hypothetical protein